MAPPPVPGRSAPETIAAVRSLIRYTRREPTPQPGERCELCAVPLTGGHPHLVHVEDRRLLCSCRPCYLLFTAKGASVGRLRAVPEERRRLNGFRGGDALWERLGIPVRLAFFFHNSSLGRVVAFYPGAAGAAESLLPLDAWREIESAHPALTRLAPDVEAALLREPRGGETECYLVPIDVCYQLTGVVRQHWRGFEGGPDVWREIDRFFSELAETARPLAETHP